MYVWWKANKESYFIVNILIHRFYSRLTFLERLFTKMYKTKNFLLKKTNITQLLEAVYLVILCQITLWNCVHSPTAWSLSS